MYTFIFYRYQAILLNILFAKKYAQLILTNFRHSLVKMLDGSELDGPPPLRRSSTVDAPHSPPVIHHNTCMNRLTRRASLDDLEQESCQLTPKIEHRIVILNNEEVSLNIVYQSM